jgi:hypothetical protein
MLLDAVLKLQDKIKVTKLGKDRADEIDDLEQRQR